MCIPMYLVRDDVLRLETCSKYVRKKLRKIIVLGVVCIGLFLIFQSAKCTKKTEVSSGWKLVIMSQSFAPTICLLWLRDAANNTCSTEGLGSWVMHGLWLPGLEVGSTVHCNDTWPLDAELIRDIVPQMNRLWTNVNDTTGYTFWSHEWLKHGTCVASSRYFNSQKKYFTQGLKWMTEYSMDDVLNRAGIMPSNYVGYNTEDIFKAILSKFKVTLDVICVKIGGRQLLREAHICFDSNLQLTNCLTWNFIMPYLKVWQYDEDKSVNTNCDLDAKTMYIRKADKRLGLF